MSRRQPKSKFLEYPTGSLTAIGEIMLILWITSILVGMAENMQLTEPPIQPTSNQTGAESTFDHSIVIGPGNSVQLDGQEADFEAIINALKEKSASMIELRPHPDVGMATYFKARYRLRESGIGYTERPPKNSNETIREEI